MNIIVFLNGITALVMVYFVLLIVKMGVVEFYHTVREIDQCTAISRKHKERHANILIQAFIAMVILFYTCFISYYNLAPLRLRHIDIYELIEFLSSTKMLLTAFAIVNLFYPWLKHFEEERTGREDML